MVIYTTKKIINDTIMTKTLFISDNSDGSNWGCFATSRELRDLINEEFDIHKSIFLSDLRYKDLAFSKPSLSDIRYVMSEYKKIVTGSDNYPIKLYNHGIIGSMHLFDYLPKSISQYESKSMQFVDSDIYNKFFEGVSSDDHVIINGEGSIHGDRRKSQMLLFLAYIAKCKIGAKTHIVNHTLQIDTVRIENIIKSIYPKLDTIAFRDPISFKQYNSKIGKGNVELTADAAWLFDDFLSSRKLNELHNSGGLSVWTPNPNVNVDFTEDYICVGGGSGFVRQDEKKAEGFIQLVNKIKRDLPAYKIILTAAASSDETFMLKVSENTNSPLIKLDNDVRAAASVVSNSDLYVGGRWHPTIFALLGNTQIVSFQGNTFKMQSIKKQLESDHPVFETSELYSGCDEVVNSIKYGTETGFTNIPLSNNEMANMKHLAEKNISLIK